MDYEITLNFSYNAKSTVADAIKEFDQTQHPIILGDPSKITKILIGPEGARYELISGLPDLTSDVELGDLASALEAESEYFAKGKEAFIRYDEYRAKRLRLGV
jgi:hypothetical protein